ncbi:MAG: nucleoside monophosphate kinase [Parcubacteria group bacterium]|nr:nucleoside monophosphate kinase [Parcubacteria group bacterium]
MLYAVLGRSGAGKGTQASLLAKKFHLRKIVTGDLFRALAEKPTVLGRKVRRTIESGGLPPAWLASHLWLNEAFKVESRKGKGIVFEGAPRRLAEATLMEEVFPLLFGVKPTPILVDVSEKESKWRLTNRRVCSRCKKSMPYYPRPKNPNVCRFCGGKMVRRKDDTPSAIHARMRFYKTAVQPVLRYYGRRLIRVNGEQPIKAVFKELVAHLHTY